MPSLLWTCTPLDPLFLLSTPCANSCLFFFFLNDPPPPEISPLPPPAPFPICFPAELRRSGPLPAVQLAARRPKPQPSAGRHRQRRHDHHVPRQRPFYHPTPGRQPRGGH